MKIENITASLVNAAVDTYLRFAYDDAVLREKHAVRFGDALSPEEVLSQFDRESTPLQCYSLRLGCEWYPHMKLTLSEAYYPNEFVFAVDRHDGFDFSRGGPGFAEWMGLKSRNHLVKVAIEDAWYEAGLPTMRRLKEDRLTQSDILRSFSGHSVLLVDNDADAGAIVRMVLTNSGYGCIWVPSVADTKDLLDRMCEFQKAGGESAPPPELQPPGLALVDVLLSDGSGQEVVDQLRACSLTQDIPIVLVSALSEQDVTLGSADAYLRKPYPADALLEMISRMLRIRYDSDHLIRREDKP